MQQIRDASKIEVKFADEELLNKFVEEEKEKEEAAKLVAEITGEGVDKENFHHASSSLDQN